MSQLTLQVFHQQHWLDCALLNIPDPDAGHKGRATLSYEPLEYALAHMGRDDEYACSLTLPVDLMQTYRQNTWFGFLEDIMPAGANRRHWVNYLGIGHLSETEQDYPLLAKGTIAPIGNLRIKEAVPQLPEGSLLQQKTFTIADVTERHSDFLEYAQAMGATSGGATGAGGEAPKLLLRCSANNEIWIDTYQDDVTNTDQHYLVKFPRGKRTQDDCDILRAEYHFYHELTALGIETIDIQTMRLLEGDRYPSLWLPRFDVSISGGQIQRFGMESVYAILNKPAGSSLNHFKCIHTLCNYLQKQYRVRELNEPFNPAHFVSEWVKRDFLNVVFGNSDNHGRNTSLIKRPTGISLAPLYDFAPMKADPEGVIRTTTWGSPFEEGGHYDWQAIARALDNYLPPEQLLTELATLAQQLVDLPQRLAARGLSPRLLKMPTLGYKSLEQKLRRWQLLE